MIQTNLKKAFEEAGLEMIRPTDPALQEMGISRRRFTMLVENEHKTPITIDEVNGIQAWIESIKSIDSDTVVGASATDADIAHSLGLTK